MNKSTGKPTKAEQLRLDQLHALPCLCCAKQKEMGYMIPQPFRTEAHHLVDKGTRKNSGGHASTVNLCSWHHAGTCLDGISASIMKMTFGPSLARDKRSFVELYGSERQLLAETDALLLRNRELA